MAALYFSNAGRWVNCPGSIALSPDIRLPDVREAADEGIEAHKVAAVYLAGGTVTLDAAVTYEMIEGAQIYAADVLKTVAETGGDLIVEGKVTCPSVHAENRGIIDAYLFDRANDTIYVWDYKFGHRLIDVFENWQLINSAIGLLDNTNHSGNPTIVLTIVQPRGFHRDGPVRNWVTSGDELDEYVNQLRASANLAQDPTTMCHAGPQCYKCAAAHGCETLQRAALSVVDQAYDSAPLTLPDESVGRELMMLNRAKTFIEARISGLEMDVNHRIRLLGKRIEGFSMVPGRSSEIWKSSVDEVSALGSMMGVNLVKPAALITPKQAVTAGIPADLIAAYTETIPGSVKLAPDNSKLTRIFK